MFGVATTIAPLYGVLVSDKSHLVGERRLVKRDYATLMAHKTLADTKLPPELIDQISDELFKMEMAIVEWKWWDDLPHQENYAKFKYRTGTETNFELNALSKGRDMGVVTTRIFVSTPYQKKGIQFFMHLSATPDMPKMTPLPFVGLPATEDTNAAEVDHYGSLGTTTTDVLPDTDHPHLQVSTTYYEPSTKLHPYFKGKDVERPDPCQAGQLTVLDVDAAKENWDAALLKEYTNKLGLHVIPTAGKDAHQPVLMCWNLIFDY